MARPLKRINRTIIINARGPMHVLGMRRAVLSDLYHFLINRSWGFLFALVTIAYALLCALFAGLYWLEPGGIANMGDHDFGDAFFFSVQTLATIGYGYMYPKSLFANLVVTAESLFGLLGVAMITGMAFAKFSRPRARVIFSRNAVVTWHDGKRMLMFRVANERANYLAEATIGVTLGRTIETKEGRTFTKMLDLPMVRERSRLFVLTWTVMHEIDERSPLFGLTQDNFHASSDFLVCSLSGYDSSMGQTIHARHAYSASDILWNHHLRDILRTDSTAEATIIDYHQFHDLEPDPMSAPPP